MSRIVRMDTLDVATQRTSVAPLLREGSMLTTVSAMTDASSSPQRPSTPDRKQHWTVDSTIVEMAPNRGVRSREDDDDYEMITPVSKTPSQTPAAPPAPRPQSSGAKLRSREDDEDYEVVVPMARPSSSHNPQLHPPDSSGSQAVSFPPRGAASSPPPMHPAEQEFQSASRQLHRMGSQKVARKGPRAGARPGKQPATLARSTLRVCPVQCNPSAPLSIYALHLCPLSLFFFFRLCLTPNARRWPKNECCASSISLRFAVSIKNFILFVFKLF